MVENGSETDHLECLGVTGESNSAGTPFQRKHVAGKHSYSKTCHMWGVTPQELRFNENTLRTNPFIPRRVIGAAQMVEMVSFGTSFDHFGPSPPRWSK